MYSFASEHQQKHNRCNKKLIKHSHYLTTEALLLVKETYGN